MTHVAPPAFTRRVVDPVVARLTSSRVATLTVAGRHSGRPRRVPVIPVTVGGERYLVSPYGESEWVRNLRASGVAELSRRKRPNVVVRAVEVPVAERAPVIAAYRRVAGPAVDRYFTDMADPDDHPVFRISQERSTP